MKRLAADKKHPTNPTEDLTPKIVEVYERGRSVGETTVSVLVNKGQVVSATGFGMPDAVQPTPSAIAKQVANRVRYQFPDMPDPTNININSTSIVAEPSLTKGDYDKAFHAFESHSLLQDPFYAKQFARKHAQRQQVLNSYNLVTAQVLKRDCYPGWVASDPVGALNKRADRDQILYVIDNGERRYPLAQFDVHAKNPKLTHAFAAVIEAFNTIGSISQEEFLYWLAAEHALPVTTESVVDQAIAAEDIDAAWQAISDAGSGAQNFVCPLELLKRGEVKTVLRLLDEWAEVAQDKPAPSRNEIINAIKALMAVEHIALDDLKDDDLKGSQ